MQRLSPLAVCLLVAGPAVFRTWESSRLDESFAHHLHVTWSEWVLLPVVEVVGRRHCCVVLLACRFSRQLGLGLPLGNRLTLCRSILNWRGSSRWKRVRRWGSQTRRILLRCTWLCFILLRTDGNDPVLGG